MDDSTQTAGAAMSGDKAACPVLRDRVIHVGLPIRCAGTVEVGNHIHIDSNTFVVIKVGGAAFDMMPLCAKCGGTGENPAATSDVERLLMGACPSCDGTGLTGERSYERLSNEGGIWHNVICPACDGRFTPTGLGQDNTDGTVPS